MKYTYQVLLLCIGPVLSCFAAYCLGGVYASLSLIGLCLLYIVSADAIALKFFKAKRCNATSVGIKEKELLDAFCNTSFIKKMPAPQLYIYENSCYETFVLNFLHNDKVLISSEFLAKAHKSEFESLAKWLLSLGQLEKKIYSFSLLKELSYLFLIKFLSIRFTWLRYLLRSLLIALSYPFYLLNCLIAHQFIESLPFLLSRFGKEESLSIVARSFELYFQKGQLGMTEHVGKYYSLFSSHKRSQK